MARSAAPKAQARYHLLEKVATGGMAQLYKARVTGPEGFDKLVAVKRILDTFSSDEDFVSMFIDEARLAALLNHPNVVQVFELGRDTDHNLFISMELVEGVELAALLDVLARRRRQLPEAAALEIVIQVLRGLHHAHVKTDIRGRPLHIVHRDVSPQNVLVNTEGVAKLLDFGVAKARGRLTETTAGLIKGKLLYMSPEQSRNKPIDARADQFAAALMLWECLVGEPCYTFDTEVQLLRAVALGEVRTFEDMGVPVDPELEAAVMAALSPNPADRFESCEDFANALLRYKQRNYPSYTPTMLGQLVADTCPDEIARMSRVPDLEGPNVQPLYVAQVDISNLAAGGGKRSKWVLIAAAVLAVLGVCGGGVAYYLAANAPAPEQQVVVVEKEAKARTIKVIEYREREQPKALPSGVKAGVTVVDVPLGDGGTRTQALLPDGRQGWVLPLGDGTYVLKVDLPDGGHQMAPFTMPTPPPPLPFPVITVALDDGGRARQATLPDAGTPWVVLGPDGGDALLFEFPDGGSLRASPFEVDAGLSDAGAVAGDAGVSDAGAGLGDAGLADAGAPSGS